MTHQPSFFDSPADHVRPETIARSTDPETSHQAAADAALRAGRSRRAAWRALVAAGPAGLTDFELAAATGYAQTSIGKRRHELYRAGLVVKTPDRRPAPSGSLAIVWAAVA